MAASNLGSLLPAQALGSYKILIREASKLARDDFNNSYRDSPKTLLSNLVLIARTVAYNDVKMANFLIRSCPSFFASRIKISLGLVSMCDHISFAAEFAGAKKHVLDKSIQHELGKADKKQNKSRISAALRLSKLWRASGPSNCVSSIVSETGEKLTAHRQSS